MSRNMGLLGKKVGMTRVYNELGEVIQVTVVEAGPCVVLQVKSKQNDGYDAIQLGFQQKEAKKVNKAIAGHVKKANEENGFYFIREFRVTEPEAYSIGQKVNLSSVLKIGDIVDIQGTSKGHGFQGVVKRHGFKGGRATHGSMFHRAPGSIGCSAFPSRVIKGKKLPGHMGAETVLKKNVRIVDIRENENIVLFKGSVPGVKNGLLKIFSK